MKFKVGDYVYINQTKVLEYNPRPPDEFLASYKSMLSHYTEFYKIIRYYDDYVTLARVGEVPTNCIISKKHKEFLDDLFEISGEQP